MLPDRVSNPGPLTYESGALPIALRGPAMCGANLNYLVYSSPLEVYGFTLIFSASFSKWNSISDYHTKPFHK